MTMDAYAPDFVRLGMFAPMLVADEEDKVNHFRQGLKLEIRKFLASQQLETYS